MYFLLLFQFPTNAEEWKKVASDFDRMWQFPNCGGALDGKHVRITQPHNSGSYYYNYKGYFSMILMALVNANYEFLMVDVGKNGRVSDGGVFDQIHFGHMLRNNDLCLPDNAETKENLNFVFVGDEAFPLQQHLMKPFAQRTLTRERRIFNYRLSRARRVSENAFGIMANRFRIFHTAINLKTEKIIKVVQACCVLHNYLRRHNTVSYCPLTLTDTVNAETGDIASGEWRSDAPAAASLRPSGGHRASEEAILCRERYCSFFNGSGSVPWQDSVE